MRVLVIDDNKAMRMIITSGWSAPGEQPTVASVLEGLLRRPVTATTSDPPHREVTRALEAGA